MCPYFAIFSSLITAILFTGASGPSSPSCQKVACVIAATSGFFHAKRATKAPVPSST